MHLSNLYLLILPLCALPGNASPAGPPILPNLPSDLPTFLGLPNATGPTGLTERPYVNRPTIMENYIDDYLVKVGSQYPDSGTGDPQKISEALAAISNWYPTQAGPDGKYPSRIKYQGVVDGVKYTFTAEEYRGQLDNEVVSYSAFRGRPCYFLAPNPDETNW